MRSNKTSRLCKADTSVILQGMRENVFFLSGLLLLSSCSASENGAGRAIEEQSVKEAFRLLVSDALAARSTNKPEMFAMQLAENVIRTENGISTADSKKEYLEWMAAHRAGFPNGITRIEISGIDDRKVYTFWEFEGIQEGEFGPLPPTNKRWKSKGFSVWTFDESDKVIQEDVFFDELSGWKQLGFTLKPPPE